MSFAAELQALFWVEEVPISINHEARRNSEQELREFVYNHQP